MILKLIKLKIICLDLYLCDMNLIDMSYRKLGALIAISSIIKTFLSV